jgi:hypothetical protein
MDWLRMRRNCLLKDVSEGKIEGKNEVTGRRGERRKQLLDKKARGYWKLKEKALVAPCNELDLEETTVLS